MLIKCELLNVDLCVSQSAIKSWALLEMLELYQSLTEGNVFTLLFSNKLFPEQHWETETLN